MVWRMYDSNQRLWWRKTKFAINDTKLYVPVVTLSAQDNEKLLPQLKQVWKEQLTGKNINQKQKQRHVTDI